MRRFLFGLAMLTASACYITPAQSGAVTASPPPGVIVPPPAPSPPSFTQADNARWMRALRLEVGLTQRVFAPGQPIFAQVTLSNIGGAPVPVGTVAAASVDLQVSGPQGSMRCRPAIAGGPQTVDVLQPRQRLSETVNVTERCGQLAPGTYTLVASLDLPGPWSVAAQGRLTAQTAAAVERPRRAALALVTAAPVAETLLNAPAPLQVTVSNYGDGPGRLPANEQGIALEAFDELGRPVRCTPAVALGFPRDLAPGQSFPLRMDAAQRCDLSRAGSYTVAARLDVAGQPLRSNSIALVRRAPAPRARLDLLASAWTRYEPGRPLPLELRLANAGPDAVYVFGFAPGLVQVEAFGDGRPLPCVGERHPNPNDFGRYQLLRPGGQLTGRIDLAQVCRLAGRHIEARITYAPGSEYDGRAWNLMAWTGTATAQPVVVEGAPPPPPVAPPHATVSFSPRAEGRLGSDILENVEVRSDGEGPAILVSPTPDAVGVVSAVDAYNRPVSCDSRLREFGPVETLPSTARRAFAVDLGQRCNFPGPGDYRVTLRYHTGPVGPAIPVDGQATVFTRVAPGYAPPPPPPPVGAPLVNVQVPGRVDAGMSGPVLVPVTVENDGSAPAPLDAPRAAFFAVMLRDGTGRPVPCGGFGGEGAPQPVQLFPRQPSGFQVDLRQACRFEAPGVYRGEWRYQSRERAGLMRVETRGNLDVSLAGFVPPPPPPHPRGNPHVRVTFPTQITVRPDQDANVELAVTSDGEVPARINAPLPAFVQVTSAQDDRGRPVRCDPPRVTQMPMMVTLAPGESRTTSVDLTALCRLHGRGTWSFVLSYQSAAPGGGIPVMGEGNLTLQRDPHRHGDDGDGGDDDGDRWPGHGGGRGHGHGHH